MFHKSFRVKSQTAIKGSDRKKLRSVVSKQFGLKGEDVADLIPNKEEMTVMKVNSHMGGNVIVYIVQGNPAFFEVDTMLYPTVYTLWKFPDLLPVFTTWPQVFKKLSSGADLMLPGVIVKREVGPNFMDRIPKGTPCSIKLLGNKAAVAVGKTAMSAEEMYWCAMRGKGVNILHTYTDQLWAFGSKTSLPHIEDPEMLESVQKRASEEEEDKPAPDVTETTESSDNSNVVSGQVSDENSATESFPGDPVVEVTERIDEMNTIMDPHDEEHDTESAQESMDDLLTQCFMCALKTRVKKSDLPLLTSNLYHNFIQPCCPAGKHLDVKKSSYKKLSKFLKAMQDRGYIKVKELSKGVQSITEVYKDHPDIQDFTLSDVAREKLEDATATSRHDSYVPHEITEMFTITAATLPFFKLFNHNKGSTLTTEEIRSYLTEYIRENKLQNEQNKGLVTLDAILSDLLLSKGEYTEYLSWNEIISRCQSKMSPAYKVSIPGSEGIVKKCQLQPVTFIIEKRAGNKKVTIIRNLEVFGIDPYQFGHEVQIAMACSASISKCPGKSQSLEVLLQGNQVHFASDLLIKKYKIPRKYIHGMENAMKPKKR